MTDLQAQARESVPVEQCDRDAYEAYIRLKKGDEIDQQEVASLRAGDRDHLHGVQIAALARHRIAALQSRADEVERLREAAQQAVVALDHELNTLLDSVCLRDRNGAARRETAEEDALPDVERMEAALASLRAAINRTGGE